MSENYTFKKSVKLKDKKHFQLENGIWTGTEGNLKRMKVLRNTNFNDSGYFDFTDVAEIEIEEKNFPRKALRKNDILIERSGGGPNTPVGRVALYDREDGAYCFSNFTSRLRIIDKEIDANYLHTYLLYLHWNKHTEKIQTQTTNIRNLEFDKYTAFEIPLPEKFNDQQHIASEIKSKLEKVEQMRQAALKQKEAVEALQQKQLDEIIYASIPENGKFKKLKQFDGVEYSSGKAVSSVGGYYTQTGIPYLQVNNIDNEIGYNERKLSFINIETHALLKRSEVILNDVLVNIVGPPIGKICFYPKETSANINQAIVRIRCSKDLDYRFLTYYLRSTQVYNYFLGVKVGVRQWNISSTNIGDIQLPILSVSKQQEIVKKIEEKSITKLKDNIETQLEAIEAMPAAILREIFDFKKD